MSGFFNPVVATKITEKVLGGETGDNGEDVEHIIKKLFKYDHVSFQSASFCNIITLDYLNNCGISYINRGSELFDNRRY